MVYPLDGGNPAACRGLEKDEVAIRWSADGRSLLCRRTVGLTAEVTSVELRRDAARSCGGLRLRTRRVPVRPSALS